MATKSNQKSALKISKATLREIIIHKLPKLLEKEPHLKEYLVSFVKHRFPEREEVNNKIELVLKELRWLQEESNRRFDEQLKILEEQNKRIEEQNKRIEEQNKRIEEQNKRIEEQNKRIEEQNKRIEEQSKKLELYGKKLEEHSKILEELMKEIKNIKRDNNKFFGALGARWGLRAEKSFRDGMKAILEEDFPVKVERYLKRDEDGYVFGRAEQIELDMIIRNGKTLVTEIKSSVSKGDVLLLKKKIEFFQQKEGKIVDRVLIISPMISSEALEYAHNLGFEVYAFPEDVEFGDRDED